MSRTTTRRRTVTVTALATVLVAATAATSAPAAHPDRSVDDLDLVASANPSAAEPVVADDAFDDVVTWRRTSKADVTATASATCDGCDAASTALQVLYVGNGRETRLDNTAAAWTQACGGCVATALSVQVVVVRGTPSLVPNNRALAVNAACATCRATGVAFQVVVAARHARRISGADLAALRTWVAEQAAALRSPAAEPGPESTSRISKQARRRAQRAADSALVNLELLVTDAVGAVPLSSEVDLRRG